MMKRTMYAALAAAVIGLFGAAPADAQIYPDYRFDLGVLGGWAGYTAVLDDSHLNEDRQVRFQNGWLVGLQGTYWFTPGVGLRAHGTYTDRPMTEGSFFGSDEMHVSNVNLWSASGDLMFRPFGTMDLLGAASVPFLALGLGAKIINASGDHQLAADRSEVGLWFTPGTGPQHAVIERTRLMGLIGLGTDVRVAHNVGLRLELGDRIWGSPVVNTNYQTTGNLIHEIYAQVGANLLLGLAPPEVVAVTPAPPPPPAPAPPPPPVVEERVMVCVIDPAAEGGIRMVEAIFLPARGDTLVVVNGQRRQFRATLPTVTTARRADWFVRGEPLQVRIAPDLTVDYVTWQAGRVIDARDLAFLGNIRGVPVYASAAEVAAVRADLRDARRTAMTDDLNVILQQRTDLRTTIRDLEFLYVPLEPVGCVFQALQQVEPVIKK